MRDDVAFFFFFLPCVGLMDKTNESLIMKMNLIWNMDQKHNFFDLKFKALRRNESSF